MSLKCEQEVSVIVAPWCRKSSLILGSQRKLQTKSGLRGWVASLVSILHCGLEAAGGSPQPAPWHVSGSPSLLLLHREGPARGSMILLLLMVLCRMCHFSADAVESSISFRGSSAASLTWKW